MTTHSRWAVLAATLLFAGPATAQQRGMGAGMMGAGMMGAEQMGTMQGGMMGGGMMMTMMMEAVHPQPSGLLAAGEALSLTPDQVTRLQTIEERTQMDHARHMEASMGAQQRSRAALSMVSPDLDAYATALNEAADHMVLAHLAMARAAVDAKAVLTPEQRTVLSTSMALMNAMHGGMMGGGAGAAHSGHGSGGRS